MRSHVHAHCMCLRMACTPIVHALYMESCMHWVLLPLSGIHFIILCAKGLGPKVTHGFIGSWRYQAISC